MAMMERPDIQVCPTPREGETLHCDHWFDCEPCCNCGTDAGGESDCDCPKHTALRAKEAGWR